LGAGAAAFFGGDAGFFVAGATFFTALRAGAGLARAGVDGFDFAAIFFDLARALAMTCNNPGWRVYDW